MGREGSITKDPELPGQTSAKLLNMIYEQLSTILVNTASTCIPAKLGVLDLINESAHTIDDLDIGEIHAINRDFVVVK